MARTLFSPEIAAPSSRRRSVIPLSLALHVGVLVTLWLSAAFAVADLPRVWTRIGPVRGFPTTPTPTVPARRVSRPMAPSTSAPVEAPDRIAPDTGLDIVGLPAAPVDAPLGDIPGEPLPLDVPEPPAQEVPPPEVVRVGGDVQPPTKTRHVSPAYPSLARAARVEGLVVIEATIDLEGRVREARVLRSVPLLDEAAVEAVRQWEFSPTRLNGRPVSVMLTVTVRFRLQ